MTATPLELMNVAAQLARETGTIVAEARASATVTSTKSSQVDIVTQVDLAAEQHLRDRLAELRPDDAIMGEEGDDTAGTSGITWLLDPIDGTVNFLYGLPSYSVSVAAVSGTPKPGAWTQLAGAVAEGGDIALWTAAKGEGAWRNGVRLEPHEGPPLERTLVSTGFQYVPDRRAVQGELVAKLLPQVRDVRRLGSCAVDICYAAAGYVDAYFEHGLHLWDFAAGSLVAMEAGLRVEGLGGAPADTDILIAASPNSFDELHDALLAAGARDLW